ncbi:predicted protein [Nematostella vectensis]|uniref:Uncharacterized protein n=1 Tax=Nematostella vectensis TaxID=45351 RepID=A7RLP8_NEMVE|nr:predicted protein [Nematostella vectensis]|eukprot:XP_001639792.1 predicted protein [Nematostella vectensis]
MSAVLVNRIQDHYRLVCGICQETYNNPKVLPCLHSFCQNCLDKSIRSQERVLVCPTCQCSVPVPAKGIEAFPVNFFINNMLTVLAVQNPTKCTNCEDSAQASARCLDCVENLCTNCVLKYFCETCDQAICRDCAIYEHRDHVYVDLKEAVKKYRSSVTHMLDTCKRKIPVLRCAVEEVKEVRRNLQDRVQTVKDNIRATIQNHIRQLEEQAEDLTQTLENMYHDKEKVLTAQQEILELDLSNLLSSSDFTENVLRYGNEAEVMLVKPQMVSRLTHLNEHDSQTEPEENEVVDFSSNDQQLSLMISCLGNVSTSSAFPLLSHAQGFGLTRAKVGQEASFKVIALDRDGEPCQKGDARVSAKIRCPNGFQLTGHVTKNEDSTYTVTYTPSMKGDHELMVMIREKQIKDSPFDLQVGSPSDLQVSNTGSPFDLQFSNTGSPFNLQVSSTRSPFDLQVTAGIDCDKLSAPVMSLIPTDPGQPIDEHFEPWGVATDPYGQLVVTDHHNHRIQIYDSEGKMMRQFGIRGKGDGEIWYPAGVAVDKSGNIFVADHGNNRIQAFTQEGEFIRKFGGKGTGLGQMKGPCGAAVDGENRVLVADRDNHRIQVFDSEGNFLFTFGSYGDSQGKFNCPRHISVSSKGEILVSDAGNFRVQVFDGAGNFLSKFGEKGSNNGQFSCPAGVATDAEGHIVVADLKNLNVQVFNSDGEFIKRISQDPDSVKNASYFGKPTGVAISDNGNVVVADRGLHKVMLF